MYSGLLSPLCCRGFPAGTAPDAGSAGESSPGPHQHFCLCCAPTTGAMSVTSAAWSTWHPPSKTRSHPSAGVLVLVPGSFRSPSFVAFFGWGRKLRIPPDPEFAFPQVSVEGALFFQALCYKTNNTANFSHFI